MDDVDHGICSKSQQLPSDSVSWMLISAKMSLLVVVAFLLIDSALFVPVDHYFKSACYGCVLFLSVPKFYHNLAE